MGQVSATLNGRTYRLSCEDGQEERLGAVISYINGKINDLTEEFGQVGDDRMMLMAAILITDELFDLRDEGAKPKGRAKASESAA